MHRIHINTPPPPRRSISLTPLIDVVFILLIFFMLASSFVQWKGVEVSVGQATHEVPQDEPNVVIIEIAADGRWLKKGQGLDQATWLQQLLDARNAGKAPQIFLHPLQNTQVQSLVDALGVLREQGFIKVGLVRVGE